MSAPLNVLEQRRSSLLQQISELGDFRPGSITGTVDVAALHRVIATATMTRVMRRTLA